LEKIDNIYIIIMYYSINKDTGVDGVLLII